MNDQEKRPPETQLSCVRSRLYLREPFRISGYTFEEFPIITAYLTSAGFTGRGEAAGVYYNNDTPASIQQTLQKFRGEIEAGLSRQELRNLLPPGGARNAIDCAMWELEAQLAGVAVWQMAGLGKPLPLMTTMTLGASSPGAMANGALKFTHAKALKLKLTGETELDIDRVKAVRLVRPDVWLGVDANQGFTPDTIEPLLRTLVECNAMLIEQPFARGCEDQMKSVAFPISTAADESCLDLLELERFHDLFDVVNIKLDKCGGLTEGLMMAERARQLGLKVMVGNMGGTGIAMAPALILGQYCDVVDLDGPLVICNDCYPTVLYENGDIASSSNVWGGIESSNSVVTRELGANA
jgi:L-alanine-DL-glutamate epimerase-like enolase superfamily enzyme